MFDFAWSEIGLIAAVALVLIGPKDLPVAIRAVTDVIKKARRMAGEFQTHVDDMLREANLGEVRDSIAQIRNFDIRSEVERTIDPDHAIRDTFSTKPLAPGPAATPQIDTAGDPAGDPAGDVALAEAPATTTEMEAEPAPESAEPARPNAPAFVPPGLVSPGLMPPRPARTSDAAAPAFIPPSSVPQASSHARAH